MTIDGPAASGKTSVSRYLAKKLKWKWVSTGSFYRGLAFAAQELNLDLKSEESLVKLARSSDWSVVMAEDRTHVIFRGKDVTEFVASEQVGGAASHISQFPSVRQELLPLQRACLDGQVGLIAEGRDCGSVVFPDAILKVFLTARSGDRAQRRATEHGQSVVSIEADQQKRDARDVQRTVAPLQIADESRVLDTSDMALDDVVSTIEAWVKKALSP